MEYEHKRREYLNPSAVYSTLKNHCVKSVRIRIYSGSHFPAFGLNSSEFEDFLRSEKQAFRQCSQLRSPQSNVNLLKE